MDRQTSRQTDKAQPKPSLPNFLENCTKKKKIIDINTTENKENAREKKIIGKKQQFVIEQVEWRKGNEESP